MLVRRLEAQPGPSAAHEHCSQALRTLRCPPHQWCQVADVARCVGLLFGQVLPPPINFARNSPAACSIIEFASLELQCFWGVSKNDHDKLRAKFGRRWCRVADRWLGALACCLARSCRLLWASRGSRVLSFWGALVRVVTNVVNPRCFSCGFLVRCYERRQSEGFFAENGGFLA